MQSNSHLSNLMADLTSPATCPASDRLRFALASAGRIHFHWRIADDRLSLISELGSAHRRELHGLIPAWTTRALPALIHPADQALFRQTLHLALKRPASGHDAMHAVDIRIGESGGQWRKVRLAGQVVERDDAGRALRIQGSFTQLAGNSMRADRPSAPHAGAFSLGRNLALGRSAPINSAYADGVVVALSSHTERAGRYRQLLDSLPDGVLVCREGKLAFLNKAACRLFGAARGSQLLGRPATHFIPAQPLLIGQDEADGTMSGRMVETRCRRINGTEFDAEVTCSHVAFEGSHSIQLVVRDISVKKRALALQSGQARILNLIATGAELRSILEQIVGLAEDLIPGSRCQLLEEAECAKVLLPVPGNDEPIFRPVLGRQQRPLGILALRLPARIGDGPLVQEVLSACTYLAGLAIDSRTSAEQIRYLAYYDGLTALPNRFLFKEHLELAFHSARRQQRKFAVLFLDLDRFKEVNDGFGHDTGDQVLREIAGRMRACLRHTDKIARMGGDEFYVLVEALHDSRYAADVARKLLCAAARPVVVGEHSHQLSASIGISIYPDDGKDAHSLLQNADAAMYRAKEAGKNGFAFFSGRSVMPA